MKARIQAFVLWWLTFAIMATTSAVNGGQAMYPGGELLVVICIAIFSFGYAFIIAAQDSTRQIQGIHFFQGLIRGGMMCLCPVLIAIQRNNPEAMLLIPWSYSIYYLVFELRLNKLRGDPYFYVGKEAAMDKIVRWLNAKTFLGWLWPVWFLVVKLWLIGMSIYLLVVHYIK
jgi:hypothetical protein